MFDLEKAISCAKKMKNYFSSIEQNANVSIPNNIVLGSKEYLNYIFYSCLLDYGMRSKSYHLYLNETYKNYSNIFDPKFVIDNYLDNEADLFIIIKENIHPRYPNVALKKWLFLSKFLNDNYYGDKLKEKIISLKSYKELYNFITKINGYGQKTGGLLLRLIYESGICEFNDELENIPMDRHDIEISYLNGVIKYNKLSNKDIEKLGKIWIEAGKKNNISACDIDKYLWSIGNKLCSKKACRICPLFGNCKSMGKEVK